MKFTAAGTVSMLARRVPAGGASVEVVVADSGIGIRPEDQRMPRLTVRRSSAKHRRWKCATGEVDAPRGSVLLPPGQRVDESSGSYAWASAK
ncbi:MAG: hypothetical protein HYY35_08500 [Deltaproteobacteria bacterium]|nr:hypothetical protein [Deltaproteobacteria bacterium]